jgi:hypothetical protein
VPRWDVDHSKTDIFRQAVDYSKKYKDRLRAAVRQGKDAVTKVADEPALPICSRSRAASWSICSCRCAMSRPIRA